MRPLVRVNMQDYALPRETTAVEKHLLHSRTPTDSVIDYESQILKLSYSLNKISMQREP